MKVDSMKIVDSPGFSSVSRNRSRDNAASKLSHTTLKSSIPIPTKVQRRDGRTRSASTCYSQPVCSNTTPLSTFQRNKTSLSLSPYSEESSLKTPSVRSKTASGLKSPYANVKSRIDNSPPNSSRMRSKFYSRSPPKTSIERNVISSPKKSDFEPAAVESHFEAKSTISTFNPDSIPVKSPGAVVNSDNKEKSPRSNLDLNLEVKSPRASVRSPRTVVEPYCKRKSPRASFECENISPRASNKVVEPDCKAKSPRASFESVNISPRASNKSPRSVAVPYREAKSPRASFDSDYEPKSPRSSVQSNYEKKSQRTEEIAEKQIQLLTIYNELKKLQPVEELQHVEGEICSLMEKKTLGHLEGLLKANAFLKKCTPEFVSNLERQIQNVSESWLKLIYDIIITKNTVGKTVMNHLSIPDPSLDLHDEITRFLTNLTLEGEPLDKRFRKVEEEQLRMATAMMHNVMALTKEYGDLQDENTRLQKTQDQINLQQNEQLGILGQENKELSRKYALAVERYNIEKSRAEQQEKNLDSIQREMLEIRKILKCNEGRCHDIELKTKKADMGKRALENALRNMELTLEKEGKQHRELFEKYSHSEEIINKLKYELEQNICASSSLEETNKDLQVDLKNMKASLEENEQKRNELVEEITNKSKKLNDMKEQIELLKINVGDDPQKLVISQDYTSKLIVQDLTRNMQDKNNQVNELKKKQHELETQLKEMAARERMLMQQIHDLMKNRTENDVILESQVRELKYKVGDLEREKSELEKILAQQTLELDQRDLMMREHARLLQARDELIPMIRERKDNDQQCTEKLMAIVYENYKSYLPEGYNVGKVGEQPPYKSLEALEKFYGLDPEMVDKELSFRQEKMTELFNLLEHKQMEINKLERRIRAVQGEHHPSLNMKEQAQKNNKWGFLSIIPGMPEYKHR